MKYLTSIFILFAITTSCGVLNKNTNSEFNGTWVLVQISGGIGGMKTTENLDEKIIIDSKNITFYKNNEIVSKEKFEIEKAKVIESSEEQDILRSASFMKKSIKIENNKLILKDQCYDCYVRVFEKQ